MPNKIKILSENLANMIAAGEVVERPASVVKELIENSIDANADRIEITCQKSGKRLIKVLDNGYGMEYDDALTCLERHATSKIGTIEDLNSIQTLGFRGEALPSIASVSEMILTTRTESNQAATRILIKAGTIKQVTHTGAPVGTIIEVINLFSNLPARAKFLRSAQTELSHIVQTVIRQSIPKPDISFILTHDGHTLLHLNKAKDLKQRLFQIMGEDKTDRMIEIEEKGEGVRIAGYISSIETARSDLLGQYLYVNRRFIRSPIIQKAIHNAYHPLLSKQKYPLFCLLIDIDPGRVDFNVHPAKLEIRFDEPSKIVDLISSVVKKALNQPQNFPKIPSQFGRASITHYPPIKKGESHGYIQHKVVPPYSKPRQVPLLKEKHETLYESRIKSPVELQYESHIESPESPVESYIQSHTEPPLQPPVEKESDTERSEFPFDSHKKIESSYKGLMPLGPCIQVDNTYILYETLEGLVIIDQHAAHERINYEKTKSAFLAEITPTQTLITHPLINVSPEEDALMEQALPLLKDLGFNLEPFGTRTYILRSVPVFLNADPAPVLQAIIHDLLENLPAVDAKDRIIDPLAATVACHLSIKAHQPLETTEIHQLINDLFSTENPYSCPHGRPTLFRISIKELEKNFGRQ